MRSFKTLVCIGAVAASVAMIGCEDDPPTAGTQPTPGSDTLTGTLTADRTLSKDTLYTIKDFFFIDAGVKLTIPAGTKIQGLYKDAGSALFNPATIITVRGDGTKPSGQIIANGTKDAPIIFTSSRPVGQRQRGDWGGIALNGMADLNVDGKNATAEGGVGAYGPGTNAVKNDDNSGVFRYVRIEYGGAKITADNEINGLTFNAVGAGTTIEYVQTHFIADDGFEWFGGTVNGKYLVSSGNDDDAFDMDFGYSGKLQFLFALQDPDLANRGFEIDNDASGSTKTPFTSATISNVTLVGAGKDKANNEDNDGFYLRRNNKLKIYNAIVTNFRYALVIDGANTKDNAANGELLVRNSILDGRTGPYLYKGGTAADLDGIVANWNLGTSAVNLTSINFESPNPIPVGALGVTPVMPPGETFFTQVGFIGAFGTDNWLAGWTNFKKS